MAWPTVPETSILTATETEPPHTLLLNLDKSVGNNKPEPYSWLFKDVPDKTDPQVFNANGDYTIKKTTDTDCSRETNECPTCFSERIYVFYESSPEFEDVRTNFQDYDTIQPKMATTASEAFHVYDDGLDDIDQTCYLPTTASEAFHVYDDSLDDIDQTCYRTTTTGIDFLTDHAVHLQTGVT